MRVIAKTCAGCKHFFRQRTADSECHRYPPRTTVLLLGMGPSNQPVLHKVVGYDLTHDGMEACGEWAPRLEM